MAKRGRGEHTPVCGKEQARTGSSTASQSGGAVRRVRRKWLIGRSELVPAVESPSGGGDMEPGAAELYDQALLGILQHVGNVQDFLRVLFGFLYRKTDFYRLLRHPSDRMGFPPGAAQALVLQVRRGAYGPWGLAVPATAVHPVSIPRLRPCAQFLSGLRFPPGSLR